MTYKTFADGAGSSFADGSSPGISAAVMNGIRDFLLGAWADTLITSDQSGGLQCKTLQAEPTAVSLNGTTAGTVTFWQYATSAHFKALIIFFNGYQNASATEQHLAVPVPFTNKATVITAAIPLVAPFTGASRNTNGVRVMTTWAAAGGTSTLQNAINANSLGWFTGSFDGIGFGVSQGSTFSDIAILWGY